MENRKYLAKVSYGAQGSGEFVCISICRAINKENAGNNMLAKVGEVYKPSLEVYDITSIEATNILSQYFTDAVLKNIVFHSDLFFKFWYNRSS